MSRNTYPLDVAIEELISRRHVSEARFQREALITARLEHPGIVPVHEAGHWPDGTPFYVMKLVAGRSLRDLLAERKTVDERIALLHHVIAVADAIAYAHGKHIIHRDLKPANVIVGDFGETVIIELYSHNAVPTRMAISPDGRMLAWCALDGSFAMFYLWNHRLVTHLIGHLGAVYSVAWIDDELWTTGDEGALKRWGLHNGTVTLRQRLQEQGAVRHLHVARSGWAAVAGQGTVLVSRDGDSVALRLDVGRTIEALDVSSDLRYIAAATIGEIVVIDLQNDRLATLDIDSPLTRDVTFVDRSSLAVIATTGLELVHIDDLDYLRF